MMKKHTQAKSSQFAKARFYIDGMSCAACSASIQRALARKDFIKSAQINLISKSAFVEFDSTKADLSDIFALVSKLGFTPYLAESNKASLQKTSLWQTLNPNLAPNPNSAQNTALDFASLVNNNTKSSPASPKSQNFFTQILAKISFFITAFNALDKKLLPPKLRIFISIVATLFVLYLSMFPMLSQGFEIFSDFGLIFPFDDMRINIATQVFCALVVAHAGRDFYFKGFATLFAKTPTMDSLIAISTTSAFVYSLWILRDFDVSHLHHLSEIPHLYFESICVIITFVLCGKALESDAKAQANEVINALLSRNAKNAIKLEPATKNEITLPINEIKKGDLLKILPASFIPVDGVVHSGNCAIDESSLSGEALPVPKKKDSPLFAGSLNTTQAFIMRATSTAESSTLSAIKALVEEAISSKPNIVHIADRVASVFVPAVIFIALVAGGIWSVAKDFGFGFEIFISVLVISCPCALGLATPLAVMIGNALANKNGVFFKNAQSFEIASKVNHAVFDKTGTLTNALEVSEILPLGELSKDEILALSAGLERGSEHIIAKAILAKSNNAILQENETKTQCGFREFGCEFSDFTAYAGLGIKAKLQDFKIDFAKSSAQSNSKSNSKSKAKSKLESSPKSSTDFAKNDEILQKGQIFALGNARFFGELDSSVSLNALEKEAICVYLGAQNGQHYNILGAIYLHDSIKPSAPPLISALKAQNITPHILSGDSAPNVARVANALKIDNFRAQASPKDKLEFIQNLKNQNSAKSNPPTSKSRQTPTIMMIGDGVNDVGALQASDISVSFANASEASEKSADIVIYNHDLGKIHYALSLSKAVLANIKQNLFWAFCYNGLCIPLACGALQGFGVLLNPMIAAFAMSASSLSVVLNAQRLWRFGTKDSSKIQKQG